MLCQKIEPWVYPSLDFSFLSIVFIQMILKPVFFVSLRVTDLFAKWYMDIWFEKKQQKNRH